MGGDGGSIVGRKELVQTAKRETTAHSQRSQSRAQVNSCALSHAPLRAPVVACGMGLLFNKDSLIEYLLAKQRFPHLSHVQQLKDVRDVTLHWNKEATVAADKAKAAGAGASLPASSPLSALPLLNDSDNAPPSSADAEQPALYSCPITGLPSNGVNRFVALLPCGCVVSERAMKSVAGAAKGAADTCMVCGKELACDAPPSPTHVAALAAADSAAAAASSAGAASVAADSTTAAPAAAAAPSRSPFYHPSYLTLFPGKEETLYLRAQMAEMLKQRELDKAAKKAAKKAAAASAATATGADGEQLAGHKRKADGEGSEARASKKAHAAASGAHSKLVASTTGSSMAERVRAITAQAAQAVAERRKDEKFNGMFLSQKQLAETKFDSISTKPASLMSLL